MTVFDCQKCGRKVVSQSQNPRCPCGSSKLIAMPEQPEENPNNLNNINIPTQKTIASKMSLDELDNEIVKHFQTMRRLQICNAMAMGMNGQSQEYQGNNQILQMVMEQNQKLMTSIIENMQMQEPQQQESDERDDILMSGLLQTIQGGKSEITEEQILDFALKNPKKIEKLAEKYMAATSTSQKSK